MALQMTPKRAQHQIKKKALKEAETFEITKVSPAQECYVNKEMLHAYNLAVFTGSFKDQDDSTWSITILLEEFWGFHKHIDCTDIFSKVGLAGYFALPPWGMDVRKCSHLLQSHTKEGEATIDGPDNEPMTVNITEEIIRDTLKLEKGDNSLIS